MKAVRRIIISRTDAIGDVVLTLPMASLLKKIHGKETTIIFFGKTYTKPVIQCCDGIDEFLNYDEFIKLNHSERINFLKHCQADAIIHVFPRKEIASAAKDAGIPLRIGTTNRIYHWWTCNKLIRLSRKNSDLHEAQLNLQLLKGFGHELNYSLKQISEYFHLNKIPSLPENFSNLLSNEKFKLVIHPKSNASAREWSIQNYTELIHLLPKDQFQIIITGGERESEFLNDWIKSLPRPFDNAQDKPFDNAQDKPFGNAQGKEIINLAGKLSLEELIALLNNCDGIIAASTGPLHIAAALGKFTLGIYPPIRPMHPGRWAPIGSKAGYLVKEKNCVDCKNAPASCHCINEISAAEAFDCIKKNWG